MRNTILAVRCLLFIQVSGADNVNFSPGQAVLHLTIT